MSDPREDQIIQALATETGVSKEHVRKIVSALGLQGTLEMAKARGASTPQKLVMGKDLVIGIRTGEQYLFV